MITGLLQVAGYTEALVRAGKPDATDEDVQIAWDFRRRRQQRLGELKLWVIVAEEILMRPIGSKTVMKEQIERLVAACEEPRTTVQILPLECGAHPGLAGSFTILEFDQPDPPASYVEGNLWDACVEEPETVEIYKSRFDELRSLALSRPGSKARLLQRAKDYS